MWLGELLQKMYKNNSKNLRFDDLFYFEKKDQGFNFEQINDIACALFMSTELASLQTGWESVQSSDWRVHGYEDYIQSVMKIKKNKRKIQDLIHEIKYLGAISTLGEAKRVLFHRPILAGTLGLLTVIFTVVSIPLGVAFLPGYLALCIPVIAISAFFGLPLLALTFTAVTYGNRGKVHNIKENIKNNENENIQLNNKIFDWDQKLSLVPKRYERFNQLLQGFYDGNEKYKDLNATDIGNIILKHIEYFSQIPPTHQHYKEAMLYTGEILFHHTDNLYRARNYLQLANNLGHPDALPALNLCTLEIKNAKTNTHEVLKLSEIRASSEEEIMNAVHRVKWLHNIANRKTLMPKMANGIRQFGLLKVENNCQENKKEFQSTQIYSFTK